MASDIRHIRNRGELAVRHIQKISPPRQLTEQVPRFAVRLIVNEFAAVHAEMQGDTSVARKCENIK